MMNKAGGQRSHSQQQHGKKRMRHDETLSSKRGRQTVADIRMHQKKIGKMAAILRQAEPDVCEWLSNEEYFLPEVVNLVYMVSFESPLFSQPLDMVRMAQYLPNTKHRPPSNASITIRLYPSTAILFMRGNMLLIKTTSPSEALYNSHLYRQVIEQVRFILKNRGDPDDKLYLGTLEGRLGMSRGRVENVVGNGILYQEGVHLTNLMHAEDEFVEWEPDTFPNLIYRGRLADGSRFCANIAVTGKVVLMGLRTIRGLYEAYKIVCDVVYNFEDPNVPENPKGRYEYRLKQLFDSRVMSLAETDDGADLNTWLDPEDILDAQPGFDGILHPSTPLQQSLDNGAPSNASDGGNPASHPTALVERPSEREDDIFRLLVAASPCVHLSARQIDLLGSPHPRLNLVRRAALRGNVEMIDYLLQQGGDLAAGVWQRGGQKLTTSAVIGPEDDDDDEQSSLQDDAPRREDEPSSVRSSLRDKAEGYLPIECIADSRDTRHKQIVQLLTRYMTKNPPGKIQK